MMHMRRAAAPGSVPRSVLNPATLAESCAAVATVLWAEREQLEALACTVVVEQLLMHAQPQERREPSAEERERIERLRTQEVLRAVVVQAAAAAAGRSELPSLNELILLAPSPWAAILADHRQALQTLLRDVSSLNGFEQLSLGEFLA